MTTWARFARFVEERERPVRVGVAGAGTVGAEVVRQVQSTPGMELGVVVNRTVERAAQALKVAGLRDDQVAVAETPDRARAAAAAGRVVVSAVPDPLWDLDDLDVVVELTGAVGHGFRLMRRVLERGRHVVSMNAECDALLGPSLHATAARSGAVYTLADGDQPGVLFRLVDEVRGFGMEVVAALNCKRHLDVHQSPTDGEGYAGRDATSLRMTTAFGDGTKLQVEQACVANALGFEVLREGMTGLSSSLADLAQDLQPHAEAAGGPFVDYTLGGDFGAGVVVVGRLAGGGDEEQRTRLRMLKMGHGPLYTFFRPWHLVAFEVPTTVAGVAMDRLPLASPPGPATARVVARAKRDLSPGRALDGQGGFDLYGVCAPEGAAEDRPPIGLLDEAVVQRGVEQDAPLTWRDVEVVDEQLLAAWREQEGR